MQCVIPRHGPASHEQRCWQSACTVYACVDIHQQCWRTHQSAYMANLRMKMNPPKFQLPNRGAQPNAHFLMEINAIGCAQPMVNAVLRGRSKEAVVIQCVFSNISGFWRV
jgi:hypothetical protein